MSEHDEPNRPDPEEQRDEQPPAESPGPEASEMQYGAEAKSTEERDSKEKIFEQIRPVLGPLTEEDKAKRFEDALFVLLEGGDHVNETLNDLIQNREKREAIQGDQEHRQKWLDSTQEAGRHYPPPELKSAPFDREGTHWRQAVEHDGEELMAGRPRFGGQGSRLSGESALLRVRAAAGLGTIVNVPLWHTGIWLKIKAPSEGTLLELERKIAREKITLGRATLGVAFSNVSVYTQAFLTDMILSHVYDGSLKDLSVKNLKETIKVTDIPQLVWGMACAIWPNGYRYVRPCVNDPTKCSHLDEAHINIGRLSWVDNRALSKAQRNLMADRDGKFTVEQLENYRKEHLTPQRRLVKITDDMSIRVEVPSIAEYERCGYRWVDTIVRMTDDAFGHSMRGEERDNYIMQQSWMSILRRYSHWVTEIHFSDETAIDDRETLDEALDGLSGEEEMTQKITDAIETFMRDAVVSAIGIPKYDCPKCGKGPQEDDLPKQLPEIIQMEVNEVFFTLHYMRVLSVLERK